MTALFTSPATLVTAAARAGDSWLSIQRRIFGPSSSSIRTRTKIVASWMIRENAAVPMLSAGLVSDWA